MPVPHSGVRTARLHPNPFLEEWLHIDHMLYTCLVKPVLCCIAALHNPTPSWDLAASNPMFQISA